jgi:hypothetical protein
MIIKNFDDSKLLKLNFYYLLVGYLISIIYLISYKFFTSSISFHNQFDFFDLRNFAIFHEQKSALSNNPSINSTGFSRVILILSIILIYYDLTKKKFSIVLTIVLFCLSFTLISLQSKFSILSGVIVYIFLLCAKNTFNHKKILNFIFIILFPLLYFNLSTIDRDKRINTTLKIIIDEKIKTNKAIIKLSENKNNEILIQESKKEGAIQKNNKNIIKKNDVDLNTQITTEYDVDLNTQITTGRNRIWRDQIDYIYGKNILLTGEGIYADLKIFGTSSSNAILYAFLCGGLISAILLIILYLKFMFQYFIYIYKKTFSVNQDVNELYFFIILILLLRSIIENSFLSIQFDFYLMIILVEILYIKKKSNN